MDRHEHRTSRVQSLWCIPSTCSRSVCLAGYLISCVSTGVSMALAIGPPVIIPFLLFGGFFLNNRYLQPCSSLYCDVMRTVTLTVIRHSSDIVVRDLAFGKNFQTPCHPERNRGPPNLLVSEYRKDFSEEIPSRVSWKHNAWTLISERKNWGYGRPGHNFDGWAPAPHHCGVSWIPGILILAHIVKKFHVFYGILKGLFFQLQMINARMGSQWNNRSKCKQSWSYL